MRWSAASDRLAKAIRSSARATSPVSSQLVDRRLREAPARLGTTAGHGPLAVVAAEAEQDPSVRILHQDGRARPEEQIVPDLLADLPQRGTLEAHALTALRRSIVPPRAAEYMQVTAHGFPYTSRVPGPGAG